MAKPRKKKEQLCAACIQARDDPHFTTPRHVVHPVTGALGVYDIYCMAVCPTCGARWQRITNVAKLVG